MLRFIPYYFLYFSFSCINYIAFRCSFNIFCSGSHVISSSHIHGIFLRSTLSFSRRRTCLRIYCLFRRKYFLFTLRTTLFLRSFRHILLYWRQIIKTSDESGRSIHKNICRKIDSSQLCGTHLTSLFFFRWLLVQSALKFCISRRRRWFKDETTEMHIRRILVIGINKHGLRGGRRLRFVLCGWRWWDWFDVFCGGVEVDTAR